MLGLGCLLVLTTLAFIMLIVSRYPDPGFYANSAAFTAIISFFLVFYFSLGRGWHRDALKLLEFDPNLKSAFSVIEPARKLVYAELLIALICSWVNLRLNAAFDAFSDRGLYAGVWLFYFLQYIFVVFYLDVAMRQLISLMRVTGQIRIDLLDSEFYSTLANSMVRHIGLYIFGVCILTLSYSVFTDGELTTTEMMFIMMPWYLPGLIIISMYLVPYSRFRRRMRYYKLQELNSVSAALNGNINALQHSLLWDEVVPSKIDLLYYQDRIRDIKEWPFTDQIRALVLFGILPPLTWVIAALIEISIEGAL